MLHRRFAFCNGCNWKVCHSFSVVHSILNSKWRHWNNMLCLSYPVCPAGACGVYEVNVVCQWLSVCECWRLHVHKYICRLLSCVLCMHLQALACMCLSNTVNDLLYYIPSGCFFLSYVEASIASTLNSLHYWRHSYLLLKERHCK